MGTGTDTKSSEDGVRESAATRAVCADEGPSEATGASERLAATCAPPARASSVDVCMGISGNGRFTPPPMAADREAPAAATGSGAPRGIGGDVWVSRGGITAARNVRMRPT